jgi:hypothetical protein
VDGRDRPKVRVDRGEVLVGQIPKRSPRHRRQDRPRNSHVASGLDGLHEGVLRPAPDTRVLVGRQIERVADAPRPGPRRQVPGRAADPRARGLRRFGQHGSLGMTREEPRVVLDRPLRPHHLRRVAVAAADRGHEVLAAGDSCRRDVLARGPRRRSPDRCHAHHGRRAGERQSGNPRTLRHVFVLRAPI